MTVSDSKSRFKKEAESRYSIKTILYYFFLILITALLTAGIIYLIQPIDDVSNFTSTIDGKDYSIRDTGSYQIKQNAADYLSGISNKVDELVSYMKRHSLPDREVSDRLYNRWRKCNLRETSSNETSAAYTVNKGEEMRICIRKDGILENPNTSMFVILHELSHMASISYGHNDEFRENFSYIVHLASSLRLYKPENFSNQPVDYCGTSINTTPCSQGTCSFGVLNIEHFENNSIDSTREMMQNIRINKIMNPLI